MNVSELFVPLVLQLGEHLDGYGNVCRCSRERKPAEKPLRPAPVVASPAIEKKLNRFRVPTWADAEIAEAERRGREVWIHSVNG